MKIETDPNGKPLNSPGAKADAGKVRPALVLGGFARALTEVAKVGTFGAEKYSPKGWLAVPKGEERYAEAETRHWLKAQEGELLDPESNLTHLAHQAWNTLARLELYLKNVEVKREA